MFIETSSPRRPNDTARLISQTVTRTTGACLRFWYHMYGTHINTLNVYTKTAGQLGTPVWSHTGERENTGVVVQCKIYLDLLSVIDNI